MHNHADMAERLKEPRFHEVHLEWMNVMCTVVLFHSQIYGSRPKHFCVDHTQYTRRVNLNDEPLLGSDFRDLFSSSSAPVPRFLTAAFGRRMRTLTHER